MDNKEQMSFDFEQPEAIKEPELYENDECSACGNAIESDSLGCRQCQHNKKKIAYQEKLKKKKT